MEQSRLIEIFLQVIKIAALSGNEKPVAKFIETFLKNLGYNIRYDESSKYTHSNTDNLICTIGNGGDFVITAHMDTARSTENVKPIIEQDKITSSGDTVLGVDNREGIAILLYILEYIKKKNINVKDCTFAFTTCEETTLFGSKYLGLNGNIKKGFIFDSGFRPGNFIYSSCGAIGFNMKIIGRASHSGLNPEKGINSLYITANAISKLSLGRIDEETTANIGILESGSAVNVVPELTKLSGEIRSFNLKKAEQFFDNLLNIFKSECDLKGAKLEYEYFWDFKPYTLNENSDVYKEIENVINKVGLIPTPKISFGGSDANSLNEKGIESVNIGIGAQNPHSNEEFVLIEDLNKSAEIALELIKKE